MWGGESRHKYEDGVKTDVGEKSVPIITAVRIKIIKFLYPYSSDFFNFLIFWIGRGLSMEELLVQQVEINI
jgi:hypothetical protein